jgi:hypothetical protein
MKRDGTKFAVALLLAIALVAASTEKRAAARNSNHAPPASVSLGLWGGSDLEMQVTSHGATLEFDCAQGTIAEPLSLDEAGKFQVKGTFQTQGGAIKRNQPSQGADVVYTGTVQGDTMRLEFTVGENKGSPEKFTLVRGQAGNLKKCR